MKPLEDAIANIFLPALLEHNCSLIEREILALPVGKGGIGVANPCNEAQLEYQPSRKITAPLVKRIELQMHKIPDDLEIQVLKQDARKEKSCVLSERVESVIENASPKMKRMIELASEKGASSWLTVIPMSEMDFTLNKREFRDALKLTYNWPIKRPIITHQDVLMEIL